MRGRFVGWFQMQIGMGVVVAFAISALLAHGFSEAAEWRWCFGLGILPPLILLSLLRWVPEEPHWLAARDRWHDAENSARRLNLAEEEWPTETGSIQPAAPHLEEKLFCRKYFRPLLLATSVALFNQLCGVTVLRVYLLDLLSSTGMGRFLSHRYGLIIACLNLLALLLGMMLVDKLGRRPLLIVGSAGMSISLFVLTAALRHHVDPVFFPVILVTYNTFFASSQGAATWVYLSEIFPFSVRGKGQGYGALVHWIANAGLIWLYPVLEHIAPQSNFLLFASMMILQIVVVLLWYPETRGTRLGAVAETM